MKITMDVECTPEEARAFLGLPDVKPMHEVQERMAANIRGAASSRQREMHWSLGCAPAVPCDAAQHEGTRHDREEHGQEQRSHTRRHVGLAEDLTVLAPPSAASSV
jgi:hypothetical protein